jgi:hypothetical protein
MALVHESFTVGTTPILVAEIPEGNPATEVKIVNDDNGTVFIGDFTVATSGSDKGLPVKKDSIYVLTLNAEDKLYAVASVQTTAFALTTLYSKVI